MIDVGIASGNGQHPLGDLDPLGDALGDTGDLRDLGDLGDLGQLIERRRALGEACALRIGERRWSYAELATGVEQRAAALLQAGVSAGELVLCPTTPVLDSLLMQWALARLGAAMLPIRADLPEPRRAALIRASGAEWWWEPADGDPKSEAERGTESERDAGLEASGTARSAARADMRLAGTLIRSRRRQARVAAPISGPQPVPKSAPAPAHQTTAIPEAATPPALLVETSGSSAAPKLVMVSAAAILASCQAVNARLDLRRGDRWLCVLPRQHVGGLAIGYRCALAGAELWVQARFAAEAVQAALRQGGITHLSLVPAQLERLLSLDPTPPPALRVVLLGGQGLDAGLARRAVAHGWPLYLGYGMSETFSQIAGGWIGADGVPEEGLIPLAGVELDCPRCELAGATSVASTLDPGPGLDASPPPDRCAQSNDQRTGEPHVSSRPLRLRAPMLMLGYANPARTPGDGLDAGWLRTSDLACRLPGGGLQVLGRADDVVLIAGINVLPAEIERQLAGLDRIAEIAVIGVPDPTWGHRLVALYTGDLAPSQLETWCRAHLPSHQRPRGFVRLESLPLLDSGKRDRHALAARAAEVARAG
ncbi:MAG: class I adenylate-forming enzyme family protein [Halochromatium sp.]|uniref:class I adenylate-forming enzyme family protein n=1 Tax=Halochromatium sp. TaxID=2049430 RepID=UPI003978D5C3